MNKSFVISISDPSRVSECRRRVTDIASAIGMDQRRSGEVAIVATELATNLIKHGKKGELVFQLLDHGQGRIGLDLIALDEGLGIDNLSSAFRDGFSSAGSAGIGLSALKRLSNEFDIYSIPGRGTAVLCRFSMDSQFQKEDTLMGGICTPKTGEEVAGDGWSISSSNGLARVLVVDGLGHGILAAEASTAAISVFQKTKGKSVEEIINLIHAGLRHTRGAAAAVAELNLSAGRVRYCGVGNISSFISHAGQSRHMVSYPGTLGHEVHKIMSFDYEMKEGSVLIMHSDGLSHNFDMSDYPGLFTHNPTLIAGVLYRDHSRRRDDTTVVVVKSVTKGL